jgi:hypothetical protein
MVLRHKPLTAGQHTSKQHNENKYDSVHICKKMLLYLSKIAAKVLLFCHIHNSLPQIPYY